MSSKIWTKDSWKSFPAEQQAAWPDQQKYTNTLDELSTLPPLVFAGEIRSLKEQIGEAGKGNAFLLQGGDCAEQFDQCTAPIIRETMKVILQMSTILTYAGEKPIIKVGRIAGQYAKPRSSATEVVDGVEMMNYRGDMVNSIEPNKEKRVPDCQRLLEGYFRSSSTLNILRAFTRGGYAALDKVHSWNKEFVKESPVGESYEKLANEIEKALNFMRVIGLTPKDSPKINEVQFFTSHEALLLGYEEALTRQDSLTQKWYDCSAHMLWIGDRTRQIDGAHIEFLRGVNNPIGMKVGNKHDIDDIRRIIERLNPENEWGRLTLITRFGKDKIHDQLPGLIQAIKKEGYNVTWSSDPMHANTYTSESKLKTRNFEDILSELKSFFKIHRSEGTVPGGIHFELTGKDVTECVGGGQRIDDAKLRESYDTFCDPRLNAQQSLEIAFLIADLLKD